MRGKTIYSPDLPAVPAARARARAAGTHERHFRPGRAAAVIGPIETCSTRIYGLSDGHFSLVDIIDHILRQTGAGDLTISTWTAAGIDIRRLAAFRDAGRVRRLRFMIDRSFSTREPDYCAVLREKIGDGNIRTWNAHAKFAIFRGGIFPVVLTTSMNLAQNKRIENFEICVDENLARDYEDMVDRLWELQPQDGVWNSAASRRATERLAAERTARGGELGAPELDIAAAELDA